MDQIMPEIDRTLNGVDMRIDDDGAVVKRDSKVGWLLDARGHGL
jgi:hypothetical protein